MLSSKVKKFESSISGLGIFAIEDIKKGEEVVYFEGAEISDLEADRLYKGGFDYLLQIDHNKFLNLLEDSKYINHSCNPSCAFLYKSASLIALRDIKKGEEITFDYSANENTEFVLNCRCQSLSCRKLILPFYKNSEEINSRLQSILTPYLKK
jgi:SET domain-containing protein